MECADELEFTRMIVNIARNADESDPQSLRLAKREIAKVRAANPQFSEKA